MLCVSTPVDPATNRPNLEGLRSATRAVAQAVGPDTLVVVRSTVPVGALIGEGEATFEGRIDASEWVAGLRRAERARWAA